MAIDALNDDNIIDKQYYLLQYFEHLKEFISAAQDNINQIQQVSNLDSEGRRQILAIKQDVQNSLNTGAFDTLSAAYYNGMQPVVSFDGNMPYGLSNESCTRILSSINQSVQEIKRLIYSQYSGDRDIDNRHLDTGVQSNIDKHGDMDASGPMSIKDSSRDSDINKITTDYNKLAGTGTTNVVYQLLSSNPYATEATLSKVLAKLEGGIKTSGGKTKDNLSDVRDIFNKATRSESRINKLISGNDDLKIPKNMRPIKRLYKSSGVNRVNIYLTQNLQEQLHQDWRYLRNI